LKKDTIQTGVAGTVAGKATGVLTMIEEETTRTAAEDMGRRGYHLHPRAEGQYVIVVHMTTGHTIIV